MRSDSMGRLVKSHRALVFATFALCFPALSKAATSLETDIQRLADSDSKVRADAAYSIKEFLKRHPEKADDHGEAYWKRKFSAVKPGMTTEEVQKAVGATSAHDNQTGGACSGQSCTISIRLDDYWLATIFMSTEERTKGFMGLSGFSKSARSIYVDPPKNFSGAWITYFVNGEVAYEIDLRDGQRTRFSSFQDNGRLRYEQGEAISKGEKPEIGFYPDGSKMYEGYYASGKMNGPWTHWYRNGKKQNETLYVAGEINGITSWYENGQKSLESKYDGHGRETGQAAWKEDGSLQYAHGSLESVYGKK